MKSLVLTVVVLVAAAWSFLLVTAAWTASCRSSEAREWCHEHVDPQAEACGCWCP